MPRNVPDPCSWLRAARAVAAACALISPCALLCPLALSDPLAALDAPPAVVALPLAGPSDEESWGGSAVVISAEGDAITLADALPAPLPKDGRIAITLPDGRASHARILRRGAKTSAVLIAIEGWSSRSVFAIAASAHLAIGAEAWTVANECGSIEQDGRAALSRGTISGAYAIPDDAPLVRGRLGRVLSTYRGPVLETDAGVNDGSEGGALVDVRGHLIGLISLGQARERRLCTAVPIDLVVEDLGLAKPASGSAADGADALAGAAATARSCLALVRFERPSGLGNPVGVPRPTRAPSEVPVYDRDRFERWWDVYYQEQQVFYTDQPAPAVVIDPDQGLLITAAGNLHGQATKGLVLIGATPVPCTVVAINKPMDLALLKANGPLHSCTAARFAKAVPRTGTEVELVSLLRQGDASTLTMTRGVISAAERRLAQSPHTWLQISARANYGSLGGVVVDGSGEIVGMSVLLTPRESWLINSGVAMAIDGAEVAKALVDLKKGVATDQLPTMGLGVALQPDSEGRPQVAAVFPGTGAAAAGLQPGDILLRVDGVIATSHMAIARALNRHLLGDKVPVDYQRAGKNASCQVELQEFKAKP